MLAGGAEGDTAGGQDAHAGAGPEQGLGDPGARAGDVLAVIEHEEHLSVAEGVGERRGGALLRHLAHADGRGDDRWHECLVGHRREFHQPHRLRGRRTDEEAARYRETQPSLAEAGRAGERQQTRLGQQHLDGCHRLLPPDERGQVRGEIVVRSARGTTIDGSAVSVLAYGGGEEGGPLGGPLHPV